MNLTLHLKKEYFDQIASGEKLEEYRLVTPYWSKRLEGRQYERVILLCGYPSASDESRKIIRQWAGYTRKTITHPHFGNAPVEVFAINVRAQQSAPPTDGTLCDLQASCKPPYSTNPYPNLGKPISG